jgi:hypothetical protein
MMMMMVIKFEWVLNLFVEAFVRVGLLTKDINTHKTNALILEILQFLKKYYDFKIPSILST